MRKKMEEKIELSAQELEDIKDTIKFRECIMLKVIALKDVPEKVTVLRVMMKIHAWLIGLIVLGIFGLAFRVLAKG